MPNLLLSEPLDFVKIVADKREVYSRAIGGSPHCFINVMYLLETIRACNRSIVTSPHAYYYARLNYNEPKSHDPEVWQKLVGKYKKEIETSVATNILNHIADLAFGLMNARPNIVSAGLPKDLFNLILRCDKTFDGYKKYPTYETIELSLRHMDITESDKELREDIFTVVNICEMFKDFLQECVRPISSEADLMERTTPMALWYFTTVLSIIYRIFSKSRNQYWYDWEQWYLVDGTCRQDVKSWVNTVPVRTPEAVLCLTGRELFSCKSIELPVEINGVVDRYLSTIVP